ncbi:hypothetical protein [Acinetobacter haemolyticus]|uniref:hypothetical protein n=1 Tax=Acinetobacter haemolyticus TaxID=29430 RepID=UPI0024DEC973|nr:hypothetical protein [Acinetobacter haemolyticus]
MRSEFEKIDLVKDRLKHVWWSQKNEYCDTGKHPKANASFLNGALYLFREQQPKITELQKQLIDQGQRFNEQAQRVKDLEHKNNELQKRLDAFKEHAVMLREAAKSHVYTEREQNILISQADDIDKILGLEQALKGEQQ